VSRARLVGGLLLAIGIALVLIGFYVIAADLWSDGAITEADFLADVLRLILPGLVAMGAGARIGRRRE
jgi:hypothetical protein